MVWFRVAIQNNVRSASCVLFECGREMRRKTKGFYGSECSVKKKKQKKQA